MWYVVPLAVILLISFLYVSRRRREIAETRHHQLSGSDPWQHPNNKHLVIHSINIQKTMQGCKEVLSGTWRKEKCAKMGEQVTLLEARAGPNLRLAESFGIENPFTTIDERYHHDFNVKIAKALRTSDVEWRKLWILAKKLAQNDVARLQHQNENISMVPLVQSLVFKVVLQKFFPDGSNLDENGAIAEITRLINRIWMESKGPRDIDSTLYTMKKCLKRYLALDGVGMDLTVLRKNLACVIPNDHGEDRRQNPLNVILPTYETIWRVVFHCIIEVCFRHRDKTMLWKGCISKFDESIGSQGQFSLRHDDESGVSMLDIVNEALRLYPLPSASTAGSSGKPKEAVSVIIRTSALLTFKQCIVMTRSGAVMHCNSILGGGHHVIQMSEGE